MEMYDSRLETDEVEEEEEVKEKDEDEEESEGSDEDDDTIIDDIDEGFDTAADVPSDGDEEDDDEVSIEDERAKKVEVMEDKKVEVKGDTKVEAKGNSKVERSKRTLQISILQKCGGTERQRRFSVPGTYGTITRRMTFLFASSRDREGYVPQKLHSTKAFI
ncbi:hypothetical protein KI688_007782 [Linnemannia hyalina]|uniref:Uncharacterized protein n=1 Tax=Linnemannia hyalina TaxID=64524 RepID=A0A9P8BM98_9FUNG|nr:hypothetical protein KI688_007782 [Linnemannia hyalina]